MSRSNGTKGPLAGVTIIEYGVFHAGPGAAAILGDLGADVIKIESAGGDPVRFWTQVGKTDLSCPSTGQSIMFDVSNRNKKGIWLDIKSPRGRAVFERLVSRADVFLTNLRKTTKEKLKLDYESIRKIAPNIIHANVSGYGPEGPFADMGAFDPMGQARSGMMFLHGAGMPVLIHLAILDQATAICLSHAILAALFCRERHGLGQEVHTSLLGAGLWLLYANVIMKGVLDRDPGVSWDRYENSPLRNSYQCADGVWLIGVHHPESKYWKAFCKATGQEQLSGDARFSGDNGGPGPCRDLIETFDKVMARKTSHEWMQLFVENGLMFAPVQTVGDVLGDPQVLENGYVVEFEHPSMGRVKIPGYPAHFSQGGVGTRSAGPRMGEHTDSVLRDFGYTDAEIEQMKTEGVIR
ncbi:MAG: CoA transferase [Thermodesulfobacteriota bacterium]